MSWFNNPYTPVFTQALLVAAIAAMAVLVVSVLLGVFL